VNTERNISNRLPSAYWRLWTASTISNLGDGVFLVALPLLASRLTRSELSISFIGVAAALPWLLLSLPIGAIVDRVEHSRLMVRADTFRAIVIGALAVAVASGEAKIWMVWVVAACLGVAEVFFDNAAQAIVPSIVPVELLEKANGRQSAAEVVANNFLGSPFGSVLFVIAMWLPFGIDAASFAAAALLVTTLGTSSNKAARHDTRPNLRAEMAEGFRWLWGHRVLRGLALTSGLAVLGMQMGAAVFVLFAQERLHLSDRWYGALLAISGVGAILGGLTAEAITKRLGSIRIIYGVALTWAASMLLEGIWPRLWASVVATAALGFATTLWSTVTVSLRQRIVPAALFGRVNSAYRWLVWGALSIGSALGGLVAHAFGLRAPFFFGAAIAALGLVTLISSVTSAGLAQIAVAPTVDDTPQSLEIDPW
jgi:predicted MFS family arabinose efflux permease